MAGGHFDHKKWSCESCIKNEFQDERNCDNRKNIKKVFLKDEKLDGHKYIRRFGPYRLYECPISYVYWHMSEVISAVTRYEEKGVFYSDGAWSDQSAAFIEAVDIVGDEQSAMRAEVSSNVNV